jgi:phosphoenolpyruvate carboxylase
MLDGIGWPDGIRYPEWSEDAKIRLLTQGLESKRPFINEHSQLGAVSRELLNTLRSIAYYMRSFGPEGMGCLIVSMSQHLSDLLLVYLLARESGLFVSHEGRPACMLQVVPLFETLDDLANAPGILEPYLAHPVVQQTLRYLGSLDPSRNQSTMAPQTIMLGYSDSNKDCGIWASQWSLYNTQKRLLEVSDRRGVPIRFFHGRGGTIGRGAGPTNRFMEALPQSGLKAGFRLTEQGEVIAQKYNTVDSAANNLAQVMAGAVVRSCCRPTGRSLSVHLLRCRRFSVPAIRRIDRWWSILGFSIFFARRLPSTRSSKAT